MDERIKKRYFHLKITLILLFSIVWGVLVAVSSLSSCYFYLSIMLLFVSSIIFVTLFVFLDRKYRDAHSRVVDIIVASIVIFLIFSLGLLYLGISKIVHMPVWTELIIGNSLLLLFLLVSYTTPGVRKSLRRAKKLPESLESGVGELKRKMGVNWAEVYIFEGNRSKIANAMQVGGRGKYVFVSSYILENMSDGELLAIIAHELAHIKFRHVLKTSLLVYFSLLFSLNSYILLSLYASGDSLSLYRLISVWTPILFIILVLPFFRRRFERQADMEAAKFVGADDLISALEKLSDLAFLPKNVSRLWNLSHPSIDDRIRYLKEKY